MHGANIVNASSIVEAAERCLRSSNYLVLTGITCDYLSGILILRGRVSTYHLKQVAQVVVSQVEEVDGIDNQIEVIPPRLQN
jgi:hypothetical protein